MATIVDVAKRAGVAVSTVSNYINKKKYVSPELQEKIGSAIKDLDFEINPVAQQLKKSSSKTIGLITADIGGLFYPYIVKGVYEIAEAKGYEIIINDTFGSTGESGAIENEKSCFKKLMKNRVDGIIFASVFPQHGAQSYFEEIRSYSNKKIPLVSVEQDFTEYGIDSVYTDGKKTASEATKHLIDCGCQNVVYISGPYFSSIARTRLEGFMATMRDTGLVVDENHHIAYGNYSHQSGYTAMNLLLERFPNLDGVFSANDQMAIGALKALSDHKKRVPEDVKVIGYDDVFISPLVNPTLSTMHIQKFRAGKEAARILFDRIEGRITDENKIVKIQLESKLIVRKSTNPNMVDDWTLNDW
jgi:DNA-binding LacI/PurR family transcriptional regulator